MKCENCGTELVGASIVCRQCNYNVAQGRVGQWRARHNYAKPAAAPATATRTISPLPVPKPEIKTQQIESNNGIDSPSPGSRPQSPISVNSRSRINPPAIPKSSPAKSSAASSEEDPGVVQFPAWRSQLKDKVKEVRDRRSQPTATDAEPDEAQLDPNPIVESALKRIRWSQHITPSQPSSDRSEATPQPAQEQKPVSDLASEATPFPSAEPKSDTRPLPRPARNSTNPLLARKPLPQPAVKSEPAPQPAPKPLPPPAVEDRIEIKPATRPDSKPGSGSLTNTPKPGSGSLPAAPKPGSGSLISPPKVRTTGEIKKPLVTQQVQPPRTPSGSLVQPPRIPVETQVIGLSPSVSDLTAGYAANTKAANLKPRQATLWGRTLAGACDFEIVAMAYLPVFWPYAVLNTSVGYESAVVLFLLLAALMFTYQLLTLTIANRTTGMAFLRLRLVNAANREKPVTFLQKFLRALAATAVAFLPPLNFLVMQSNMQHRSLPDLISGTMLLERVKSN